MGSANQNCAFGPCLNPWDKKAIPGGSLEGQQLLWGRVMFLSPAQILVDPLDNRCYVRGYRDKAYIWTGLSLGNHRLCVKFGSYGSKRKPAYDCGLVLNAIVGFDPRDSTSQRTKSVDYCALMNADNKKIGKKPLEGMILGCLLNI